MTLTEEHGGFDLERARGLRDFLQDDCAEVGDVWAEMIAEIERLRADIDDSEKRNEDLRKGIDDLSKTIFSGTQAAKIKELEDALVEQNKALYRLWQISIDEKAKLGNKEKRYPYGETDAEDDAAYDLQEQLKEEGLWDIIWKYVSCGRIGPDADAKPREGLYGKYCISKADGSPVDPNADYFVLRLDTDPVARRAAREYSYVTPDRDLARGLQDRLAKYDPQLKDCMNIQFFGLEKPRVWQITEERKAALWHAINVLKENDIMEEPEEHLWDEEVTVLQAMLTEAGQ